MGVVGRCGRSGWSGRSGGSRWELRAGRRPGSSARHAMPPTPRWTRPAGATTWSLTVAVRPSCRPPPPAVPTRAVRRCRAAGRRPPVGAGRGGRHGDGAPAPEGLSDREAISALRRDIVWKVACGLRLDDEGFHPTVLVYWCNRNRIRTSPGHSGSCRRSARWWSKPGCFSGSAGGCWTPPSWRTRSPPGHRHPQLVAAIRRVRLVAAARETRT
jgi:Transposase domain (DUF772)